jgi:DNA-binding phage protein
VPWPRAFTRRGADLLLTSSVCHMIRHMQKTTTSADPLDTRHYLRKLTRPLTSAEVARIRAARQKTEEGRRELEAAIVDAFNARGSVKELAEEAGINRQTIYNILRRQPRG